MIEHTSAPVMVTASYTFQNRRRYYKLREQKNDNGRKKGQYLLDAEGDDLEHALEKVEEEEEDIERLLHVDKPRRNLPLLVKLCANDKNMRNHDASDELLEPPVAVADDEVVHGKAEAARRRRRGLLGGVKQEKLSLDIAPSVSKQSVNITGTWSQV